MNFKTSKTLSIIAASIIFIAFFMPWTKSILESSASAWDIIEQLSTILIKAKKLPSDIRAYLPFILIAIPICSIIIIIKNTKLNLLNNVQLYGLVVSISGVLLVFITEFKNITMLYFGIGAIVWGIIIILFDSKNKSESISVDFDTAKISKIITVIAVILVIIALVYAQIKNPFSDFLSIFNMLDIGFYLTIISTIYLIIDLSIEKTKNLSS